MNTFLLRFAQEIYNFFFLFKNDLQDKNLKKILFEWAEITKDKQKKHLKKKQKKILFLTGSIGTNTNALSVESYLSHFFNQKGHDCYSVICGGSLPSCEFNIYGKKHFNFDDLKKGYSKFVREKQCNNCERNSVEIMKAVESKILYLDAYKTEGEENKIWKLVSSVDLEDIRNFIYKEINVGEHAFSSTLRILMKGEIDLKNKYHIKVIKKQLLSSIIMVERFSKLIDEINPNKVVGTHGIYLFHGIATDICNQKGYDIFIYQTPYRKNTLLFCKDETYHKALVKEDVSYFSDLKLDEIQNKLLDTYLESKLSGGKDNVMYHPNPIFDIQKIKDQLKIDESKPVFSLFTNVVWDAQIYHVNNAFKDIFEWLYFTIDYFIDNPNLQLIIRVHPAETKGGYVTNQPIEVDIRNRYKNIPNNIKIISAESNISSYSILSFSKAALIYGTKMALEIAIRGVPIIISGESFCRNKGFSYDVNSKNDYLNFLNDLENFRPNSKEMILNAKKFAYFYFFQKMIDVKGIDIVAANLEKESDYFDIDFLKSSSFANDKNLNIIHEAIMKNKKLHIPAKNL